MSLRDFFEKIIPLLGDMFDCKAQSKKQHRNSDTLSNLEENIPKLAANDLHTIQRLGSYAAHEGQYHTDEYPLKKESILHAVENGRRLVDLFFPKTWPSVAPRPMPRLSLTDPFVTIIKDATHCAYCDASIGVPCVTKDGREVGKGLEHTARKRRYETYRKMVRDGYGTTIIQAMREFTLDKGESDFFGSPDIHSFFKTKYPAFKRSSIGAHINMMCTNSPSRIHHSQHDKPECQLFYKDQTKTIHKWPILHAYRLYNSKEDPPPITRSRTSPRAILVSMRDQLQEKLMRGEQLSSEELMALQRGEEP